MTHADTYGDQNRPDRAEAEHQTHGPEQILQILESQTNDDAGKHPKPHGD